MTENYEQLISYETQDNLTFVENVNLDYLKIIVKHFEECYPLIGKPKDVKKNYKVIEDKETILTLLKNRLKNKENKFVYKPSTYKEGRIFTTFSLCGMSKALRHTLGGNLNYDIDIVNSGFTCFRWFCKTQNLKCPLIEKYCNNRSKFFQEANLDYDNGKQLLLSLLFDENREFDVDEPLYFIYEEIKKIQDFICKFDKKLYDKARRKNEKNAKGAMMADFYFKIENKILQCMLNFCDENNIRVSAPGFDGLMLYKEDVDKYGLQDLLQDLEIYVDRELSIKIELSEKKMDKGIQDFLEKFNFIDSMSSTPKSKKSNEDEYEFDTSLVNDEVLATYILNELYQKKIFYYHKKGNKCFIYDEKKCLYVENEIDAVGNFFKKLIQPYYEKIDLYNTANLCYNKKSVNAMKKAQNYLSNITGLLNVLKFIKILLKEKDDTEFINNTFNRNPGVFPFNDKVYDFKLNIIRDRTREDFFTQTTANEYICDYNEKYVRNYIKEILKTDDEAYVDSFSLLIGYIFTGYNNVKKFIIFSNEEGNNGKSVFIELLNNLLGFMSSPSPDKVFTTHKFDGSSSHQAHMFPLVNKRLVYMVEPNQNQKINIDLIKKITGDDKEFEIRRCGGRDSENVFIECKLIMVANEIPKFDDQNAFNERILNIDFANKFEKNLKKKDEILSYKNDFFSYFCNYAHKFIENNYTINFVEQMISSSNKVINDNDTIVDFISNNYELTNNKKDRVKTTCLWENYKYYSKEMNNKITEKSKFYKALEKKYNLQKVSKTHYVCIKEIIEGDDEDFLPL